MPDGRVAVRDAKNTKLPGHVYPASAWSAFLAAVRDGDWVRS